MSDLNQAQLAQLEAKLVHLREELTGRLGGVSQQARPVDLEEPIGRLARMDAMQVQQMAQAQRRRDEAQLQLVGSALARLRGGTYGECLRCEEPIGFERLEVSPQTPFCRSCRERSEQR